MFGKRRFLVGHGREATCRLSAVLWTGGTAALLLVDLTIVGKGWGPTAQALVVVTLALLYAGLYAATLSERDRVLTIRPY